jgi:hypothetical protein
MHEVRSQGHDVLRRRAAAVNQDHRSAGFGKWLASFENRRASVGFGHLVRSMTTP